MTAQIEQVRDNIEYNYAKNKSIRIAKLYIYKTKLKEQSINI